MGNMIPGQGFFCLPFVEGPEAYAAGEGLDLDAAFISAAPGLLSSAILEAELPHLFEGEWDWQVLLVGVDQFLVVFPNKAMLRMATRSGKLFLSLNNIMAKIREAREDEPKAMSMPEVWVKVWGVPPSSGGWIGSWRPPP